MAKNKFQISSEEAKDMMRRFVMNVKIVAEKKNIDISDIENAGFLSAGYLSRLNKTGGYLNLYSAYCIADFIGESLDNLLKSDLYKEEQIQWYEKEIARLKGELTELKGD